MALWRGQATIILGPAVPEGPTVMPRWLHIAPPSTPPQPGCVGGGVLWCDIIPVSQSRKQTLTPAVDMTISCKLQIPILLI